jgi:uncharacterized protein (TIGR04255 family)
MSETSPPTAPLPEYERPPVQEVALAVYFAPIEGLRSYHYGDLAARWKTEYPVVHDQPPLPDPLAGGMPQIQLVPAMDPLPRCWFLNSADDHLIQVQRERLVLNWRKREHGYPRYSDLRPRFVRAYTDFSEFLEGNGLASLRPTRVEITYVNQVPIEGPLTTAGDIDVLLAPVSQAGAFLPRPSVATFGLEYPIVVGDEPVGDLTVQAGPADGPDGKVFILQLMARGRPVGDGLDGVLGFHDVGHEWIVQGFTAVTTPQMHAHWGRKR